MLCRCSLAVPRAIPRRRAISLSCKPAAPQPGVRAGSVGSFHLALMVTRSQRKGDGRATLARRRTTGPPGPSPLFFAGLSIHSESGAPSAARAVSGAPTEAHVSVPDSPDRVRSDYRWKTISYCVPPSRLGLKRGIVLLSPPRGVHRRQPSAPFRIAISSLHSGVA
jgi:hypothetical protein